jgi:hypothetical protein
VSGRASLSVFDGSVDRSTRPAELQSVLDVGDEDGTRVAWTFPDRL